jgi:polysaccharide export outer membrane protein
MVRVLVKILAFRQWSARAVVSMVRFPLWFLALALIAPLAACHYPTLPPSAQLTKNPKPPGPDDYIIGPGDTLSIFVYQAADLSVTALPVRPDGRISVPLVPDMMAAGKTPTQLGEDIAEKLRKYVKDPTVTVMMHSFVGPFDRQVRVIGEAADPMAIPYRDHLTVLDVMIEAKGLTKYAAGNRSVIVRRLPDGKQEAIHVKLDRLLKDGDIAQNVEMQPGDTLIIPQSWF